MNRIFRFTLYFFMLIIFLLGISAILISSIYSDEIEETVIKNINLNINTAIRLNDIQFTLWEHFPFAAVKFKDLTIYENNTCLDTLVYAQESFINISLFDIALNKNQIKKINLDNAILNIRYDENKPNYMVFNRDSSQNKKVYVQKVILNNTTVNYKKENVNTFIKWTNHKSEVEFNNTGISINGKYSQIEEFLPFMISDMDSLTNILSQFYLNYNFLIHKLSLDVIKKKKYSLKKKRKYKKKKRQSKKK